MALFSPDLEVNHIKGEPRWEKLEAVVDSGAAESVAPESMAPWVPMKASEGSKRGQTYMSASGAKLPNLGEKQFDMVTGEGIWVQATFQVAEVTLAAIGVAKVQKALVQLRRGSQVRPNRDPLAFGFCSYFCSSLTGIGTFFFDG